MIKLDENGITVTPEVIITRDEAKSLLDWIENDFIEDIRRHEECYSLIFVENILRIYRKCKDYLEKGESDAE